MPDQYGLIQMGDIRLGLVEIGRLHQRRANPRRMDPGEYEALKRSVEKFGFSTFILVEEDAPGSFGVIDGHHRWKLAQERNMERVPVVVLKIDEKGYADLAMLTFNVSGSPVEEVFVDLLAELTRTLGAEQVGLFTALDEAFLSDLTRTAQEAMATLDAMPGMGGDGAPSGVDGEQGAGWQGKAFTIEFPRTPEIEALFQRVRELTNEEVLGQAVMKALREYVAGKAGAA